MKTKPYTAKTIGGAQARVRQLEKVIASMDSKWGECVRDRDLMARLAADGPAFQNPMEAMAAKTRRDLILRWAGLNPDGSPIKQTTAPGA